MSRLKVLLRGALISEMELTPEKEYVGGRKEGCDIRLQAEKGISREHFKLKFSEGIWKVTALSRFGDLFSLGQKVEEVELQHGQSFQIPPYEFTFQDVPDAGLPVLEEQAAPPKISETEKTVIGAAPQVPYIKMVNSSGVVSEMLRLEVGDVWVAGRDPSCQIIIPDQRVSRRQFEIYKVNGAYTILDLASVNGTFLNGSPVSSTDPQTLKSGDAINVLDNVMYFELHDPNFKYKMERIEIPPIQPLESVEEDYVDEGYAEDGDLPPPEQIDGDGYGQIEQYGVPEQISAGDNVFTGIPLEGSGDPNQFYSFDAPPQQPPAPPPQGIKKLTQNKPLLVTLVLIFLAGAYFLSDYLNPPAETKTVQKVINESDPFARLTPEQQKEVQEYYSLAEQMYNQQKYELAIEKIKKINELLPGGYKDSKQIEADSEKAILTFVENKKDEELAKEKAERLEKIKKQIEECEKLIGPDVTYSKMQDCLVPVTQLDPENNDVIRLLAKASDIEKERQQKAEDAKNYEQQVADFKKLFAEAEDVQKQGYAFKAIKKYQIAMRSTLPDPDHLKDEAKKRIDFIESKIHEKSQSSINQADDLFKQGKLKESILSLRAALIYDPDNSDIQRKIELYTVELDRRVRSIYQESIIEENYGLVDSTETKEGAKEKWKKITQMDLRDGEYYRKAVIKLRRYGVY